ncbi:uncharacterized protein EDB93DRAFT_1166836 [Suillus bovinus]|uniref:uncharacterized protein n=1 Tax=Suillus bovinus TaxID=48563 RepID=UPI001B86E1B7|nr:uncharacterized protein EDB93DRAFT_1166836 [Suillus bovinus]KAG2137571.1 hypothetical protein EDB93DRAFT_1166836 [Suillus bovinus]
MVPGHSWHNHRTRSISHVVFLTYLLFPYMWYLQFVHAINRPVMLQLLRRDYEVMIPRFGSLSNSSLGNETKVEA